MSKIKKAVESVASAANRNILSFLPILGEGEALIVGVDFPMPLIVKNQCSNEKTRFTNPKIQKMIKSKYSCRTL